MKELSKTQMDALIGQRPVRKPRVNVSPSGLFEWENAMKESVAEVVLRRRLSGTGAAAWLCVKTVNTKVVAPGGIVTTDATLDLLYDTPGLRVVRLLETEPCDE